MTYSIYPHNCGFSAESVVYPAYELNIPTEYALGKTEAPTLVSLDASNVIVESVKPAEDGTDAFVLRAYECEGTRAEASFKLGVPADKAVLTNLLEDEKDEVALSDGEFKLSFKPFEIKTVKIYR